MYKPKASSEEKIMDLAISGTRRPYDYKITKQKLEAAAIESHEYLNKLKRKKPAQSGHKD
jgi:hypothetical protein